MRLGSDLVAVYVCGRELSRRRAKRGCLGSGRLDFRPVLGGSGSLLGIGWPGVGGVPRVLETLVPVRSRDG